MCIRDKCQSVVVCYGCGRYLCQSGEEFCELLEYHKMFEYYFCRSCTEIVQKHISSFLSQPSSL